MVRNKATVGKLPKISIKYDIQYFNTTAGVIYKRFMNGFLFPFYSWITQYWTNQYYRSPLKL